jgi:hypothetical protein
MLGPRVDFAYNLTYPPAPREASGFARCEQACGMKYDICAKAAAAPFVRYEPRAASALEESPA